ncbi:C4-dicarboxylate ABC transporter [Enterococcus saigonensis]|uniref:C4-dicarboxylate ABC transporter n=1 Tax=Enterococcus saigonensis TaxID=1805431 RepID=A0A679ILA8_9ENTE|nr:TDT family transporter [Enterococcus saigonensis]BCA86345.1 C4-dicarboxylate ABC transporter [Enterococcus saigonensis]
MREFLKIIPIPICGLILGLATCGNVLKTYGLNFLGNSLGLIAGSLFIAVLLKVVLTFGHAHASLQDPIVASVSPTFTMGTMVLCTYLLQIQAVAPYVKYLWLVAILIHYYLVTYFTYHFLIKPSVKMDHLYPSWFIVYVGIGVISVTSSNFFPLIGQINFWVGLLFYLVLLPLIIHRVFLFKNMAEATLPLITIIAAPGSLELTGYLKAFSKPNMILVIGLLILSQILYWFIIFHVLKMIRLPFYPSYAAFTFPLAISAFASRSVSIFLAANGYPVVAIEYLAKLETAIAVVMVLYVLGHYMCFLAKEAQDLYFKHQRQKI